MRPPRTPPPLVVVMGVSGTGKSTVGEALADRLGVDYADADDFHSAANKRRMAAGVALTDADRRPWLDQIGRWLAGHEAAGGVVACSALKRRYRDRLRGHVPRLTFVHLHGDPDLVAARMQHREGHFMPTRLLDSQLGTLEPLAPDETGILLDVARPVEALVDEAVAYVGSLGP